MRENRIIVEQFHFLNIISLECVTELNHHGRFRITGLIEDSKVEEYEKLAEKELWVCVKVIDENEEESIFFYGILTGWELSKENGGSVLSLEMHTGSYLLDIEKHIRSYQTENSLYSQVMKQCLYGSGAKFIMLDKKELKTDRFLFQYDESNWEFLVRISGYMNTVLIPESVTPGKKFYIGFRKTEKPEEIDTLRYRVITTDNQREYVVLSRDIYRVGELVMFHHNRMYIRKAITRLEGNELCHEYHLSVLGKGYRQSGSPHKIRGLSLLANVIDVENTRVKIKIQKDENKEKSGSKWFDYATVYSTPDGTGWYCMPEIGDEVRILFPDDDERNAYVMSSVHLEAAGGRENPEHKSWKNRQNKEILFTPTSLILRNNKGLTMELSDREGIKIISDKDIMLQAGGDVNMVSGDSTVDIKAKSLLSLEQGCARIEMSDAIKIYGGKIYMN